MIEYLYNAIRATKGEDITVVAKITDDENIVTSEPCHFAIYDENDKLVLMAHGELVDDLWEFTVPAEDTAKLTGRYWYCICKNDGNSLCFKQPIYLV